MNHSIISLRARVIHIIKQAVLAACFLLAGCSKDKIIEPQVTTPAPEPTEVIKPTPLSVVNTLQSNMVIQRDKPFSIWGRAEENTTVEVSTSWNDQPYKALADKSGNWQVILPAATVNTQPQRINVFNSNGQHITLNNILIGDVWICSGQSNMVMPVAPDIASFRGVLNYADEVAEANYPQIRALTVSEDTQQAPAIHLKTATEWKICSPETAGKLSAVAYFFARKLYTETQVPIGIIIAAANNTKCQQWVNRSVFDVQGISNMYGTYNGSIHYNAMVHPFKKMGIKGFTWYQGENNWNDVPDNFAILSSELIKGWREEFAQGDLPFYYAQLAPFAKNNAGGNDHALFREGQAKVRNITPNCGMAVITDTGEPNNNHPRNKKPVGERLAMLALQHTYALGSDAASPTFKNYTQADGKLIIEFEHAQILKTSGNTAINQLFYVAGNNRRFYKALAVIHNSSIVLTIPNEVGSVAAIRYAFTNAAVPNIYNSKDLPIESFRTDNWQ